jgi:hypothetical protein
MTNAKSERLASILKEGGIATKEVNVFGLHCIVTCWCLDSATKVANVLRASGWQTKGPLRSFDYAKENKNTCLLPSRVDVWRTYGKLG